MLQDAVVSSFDVKPGVTPVPNNTFVRGSYKTYLYSIGDNMDGIESK